MEKIVIRTDQAEPAPLLVSLLNRFFPECGIHIVTDVKPFKSQDRAERFENALQEGKNG